MGRLHLLIILAITAAVQSGAIPEDVKPLPGQRIKQLTMLGSKLPQNATKLEVCLKSEPSVEDCDVFQTTALFDHISPKARMNPKALVRIFYDRIIPTTKNIFASGVLGPDMITMRKQNNTIFAALANVTHPALLDLIGAFEKARVTGDDSYVRDLMMAGITLEVFCDNEYYGEECLEHCPQGCPHGTCKNGICSDCEYPYHGEACDRCGETGDCVKGVCKVTERGDIMDAKCECNTYYDGPQCASLINNCTIVPCSPHGRCDQDTHKCICFDNRFEGNFCEIYNYWGSTQSIIGVIAMIAACLIILSFIGGCASLLHQQIEKGCTREAVAVCCHQICFEPKDDDVEEEENNDDQVAESMIRLDLLDGRETHL